MYLNGLSVRRSLIDVYHNQVRTTFNCSCICFRLAQKRRLLQYILQAFLLESLNLYFKYLFS